VEITVAFDAATVKEVRRAWHQAVQRGHRRLVLRITALLYLGAGAPVAAVAERVGVSESSV
jgi:hypothetical protein